MKIIKYCQTESSLMNVAESMHIPKRLKTMRVGPGDAETKGGYLPFTRARANMLEKEEDNIFAKMDAVLKNEDRYGTGVNYHWLRYVKALRWH